MVKSWEEFITDGLIKRWLTRASGRFRFEVDVVGARSQRHLFGQTALPTRPAVPRGWARQWCHRAGSRIGGVGILDGLATLGGSLAAGRPHFDGFIVLERSTDGAVALVHVRWFLYHVNDTITEDPSKNLYVGCCWMLLDAVHQVSQWMGRRIIKEMAARWNRLLCGFTFQRLVTLTIN